MVGSIVGLARKFKTFERQLKHKSRAARARFRRKWTSAKIIAVTGSSAKTTTVALLSHILAGESRVLSHFLQNGYVHAVDSLRSLRPGVQYAVLEQGTDGPGQIPRVAQLIKPNVAIITLVAIEHYTSFRSIDAVAKEKGALVEVLSEDGLAVLNFDDPRVRAMSQMTRARSVMFGTTGGDYVVSNIQLGPDATLSFRLSYGGRYLDLRTQFIGPYNWLAVSAAATAALELGIHPDIVAGRIAEFAPVRERMSMHMIPNGSRMILDTAKAPYHSILLPLEALSAVCASKKRFIMGQISDYAGNPKKKYREAYAAAAKIADEVCFVGQWAHKARAPAEDIESGKFRSFANVEDLSAHLKNTAVEDEVIVVKSSRNLHLERLMLDRISDVRCWANECGNKASCKDCGLYESAFHEHEGKRRKRKTKIAVK